MWSVPLVVHHASTRPSSLVPPSLRVSESSGMTSAKHMTGQQDNPYSQHALPNGMSTDSAKGCQRKGQLPDSRFCRAARRLGCARISRRPKAYAVRRGGKTARTRTLQEAGGWDARDTRDYETMQGACSAVFSRWRSTAVPGLLLW
jgi:hypothetical protein